MSGLLMLTTGRVGSEGHVKLYSSMEYGFMECAAETFYVRFSMEDAPVVHHKFLTAGSPLQFKLGTSCVATSVSLATATSVCVDD